LGEVLTMSILYVVLALIVAGMLGWVINAYIPLPGGIKRILNVVLALIVVGIALWLINTYVPMAGSIKAILNIVVVIATCVGVLQAVGLWSGTVRLFHNLRSHHEDNGTVSGHESKV
jgi:undecaprenyl pyrophosphate phosphatase UppP